MSVGHLLYLDFGSGDVEDGQQLTGSPARF